MSMHNYLSQGGPQEAEVPQVASACGIQQVREGIGSKVVDRAGSRKQRRRISAFRGGSGANFWDTCQKGWPPLI